MRALAAQLRPRPAVPPFYVEVPAVGDSEIRAIGWYMRRTREGKPVFLGFSAAAAELELSLQLERQQSSPARAPGKRARRGR